MLNILHSQGCSIMPKFYSKIKVIFVVSELNSNSNSEFFRQRILKPGHFGSILIALVEVNFPTVTSALRSFIQLQTCEILFDFSKSFPIPQYIAI